MGQACSNGSLLPHKLKMPMKTRFTSKVEFFQETLEFANDINICYCNSSLQLQSKVPCGKTWAMAKALTKTII